MTPNHNTLLTLLLAGAVLFAAFASEAAPVDNSKMRDVAKHDTLSQKLRMAQQNDPIREMGPPIGKVDEDPSVPQSKRSLLDSSTLLSFRGQMTLVPKRAVLHVPEHLENRIGINGKVEVVNWHEFYVANRGWIRAMEVTRSQALGDTPFSEETIKAMENSSSMIVATYKNGPISVRPPKEEDDSEDTPEGDSQLSQTTDQPTQ